VDSKIDFTAWARNLPVESIPAALAQLAAVQSALAVRLMGNISDAADGSRVLNNGLEPEPLVDAKEMARRLDVHESWVRTEQRAGRIPFVQIGRYIRFRPSEVVSALKTRPGDGTRL
jgi:excisionase family DNA binding protein